MRISEWKSFQTTQVDSHRTEVTIARDIPLGTTAEEFRELVAERMGTSKDVVEAPTDFPDAGALVERAGSAADKGGEERALRLVEKALPTAFAPDDRIEAFQLLRSLDRYLVYRGEVTTLSGPPGIGVAWFDEGSGSWHTFVFDADTGRYLGLMVEAPWPDDEHLAIVEFTTVLGTDVVEDDGRRGG